MNKKESIHTIDAYDVPNYDIVYVVIKPQSELRKTQAIHVKYSEKKSKYFIKGRVVRFIKESAFGDTHYPRRNSLAFVFDKHIDSYNNAKTHKSKAEYINTIGYGEIEYIVLPMDELDWLK